MEKIQQISLFSEENVETDIKEQFTNDIEAEYGDIYALGEHRLMCGDSTKMVDINKLLNNSKIDMLFTDPPYNVSFNGRSGKHDIIKNDNLTLNEFDNFIGIVSKNIKTLKIKTIYIWCNWKFYGLLQSHFNFDSCIVWAKNMFGMGVKYRHQHEFCLFSGYVHPEIKNESDLWFHDKDINYLHPTQKPVALSVRAIKNSSNKSDNILDLFGGSGSTLLGCELTKRKCFCMELDPKYVNLIINRWELMTGKKAKKENVNV